jgi:polyphenol oxidase
VIAENSRLYDGARKQLLRWPVATKTHVRTSTKKKSAGPKIEVLRAEAPARIPWLVHGFSTRHGGGSKIYGGDALNLGFTAHDARAAVERNRALFVDAVATPNLASSRSPRSRGNARRWPLVTIRQVHSDLIHCFSNAPKHPLAGDGLITRTPGILLGVLTADCLPVVVVDTRLRAVGVFHAGWRGTLKRIVEKGIGEMRRHFGSRPQDMRAVLGPGIRGCCYEVGPELKDKFHAQFSYANDLFRETKQSDEVREKYPLLFLTARAPGHSELPKKIFLDLAAANRSQLVDAGVPPKNVCDLNLCTSCRTDLFFSHRAERGNTGRMMAVAGIREQ